MMVVSVTKDGCWFGFLIDLSGAVLRVSPALRSLGFARAVLGSQSFYPRLISKLYAKIIVIKLSRFVGISANFTG